jgi:phenylacetate-CoA ligase
LAAILADAPGFRSEYVCILQKDATGREDLLVRIECDATPTAALVETYSALLKQRLGVEVLVELVALRALSELTGVETRQKPIRLIVKT